MTDGDLTYALTNRHVTGGPGREISTYLRGAKTPIGVSSAKQVGCLSFGEVYAGWPGDDVQLNLDAGLIELDDLQDWTTQVLSMGPMDEVLDINTDSLTLEMIDEPVRAFGGASGELQGRIAALFYRYRSIGGTDFVSDFLIRPASPESPQTTHGDSGTLWFWEQSEAKDTAPRLRPFAVQWGGHTFVDDGELRRQGSFALATSLSTICRELDVTVVRDWNAGLPEYWGDVGHYTIGYFACDQISGDFGGLMKANQLNIAYPTSSISSSTKIKVRGANGFVPLADVPDRVWKMRTGAGIRGNSENGNHFADMDQKLPDQPNKGQTLLQLCADKKNISVDFWLDYYDRVKDPSKGLLPFRVWQFFDEMVDAASKGDVTRFVCAAGISAHYVGDSCQPLHISYMFNGEPVIGDDGKKTKRGNGVHEAYESHMLTKNAVTMLTLLEAELKNSGPRLVAPKTGQQAANLIVDLMTRTFAAIKPIDIVNAYVDNKDLWEEFKTPTVAVIADGIRTLAKIWQGAWTAGEGKLPKKVAAEKPADLMKLYLNTKFVPSMRLKDIGPILK